MALETDDELPEATALIATVDRLWGGPCRDCQTSYPGHDAVFSIVLGFKDAPRCLTCLARGLKRDPGDLRRQLFEYVQRRDCYRQAWAYANERTGSGTTDSRIPHGSEPQTPRPEPTPEPSAPTAVAEWNAGDMSCGELVLALRIRLMAMAPGCVLRLIARDPAAPEDLPAWCRLTGHALIEFHHPEYLIRRKEN